MRKPIIVGNWKMNKNLDEVTSFINEVANNVPSSEEIESAVCGPYVYLPYIIENKGSILEVGAQNMHFEENGAFTGEISPVMLKDINCKYVIIGHSERRQYFNETDGTVNKKIHSALKHQLAPIVCVGESLEQREQGETNNVIKVQVENGLKDITTEQLEKLVIAYEPIWAIGTGKTATSEQANETCGYIREVITDMYGSDSANKIRIQYGGSVKPENVKELMNQEHIDGALVGGASLDSNKFLQLLTITIEK